MTATLSLRAVSLQAEPTETATPARAPRAVATGAGDANFSALVDAAGPLDGGRVHQHSRSGELEPIARFESFVLGTMVETMLPKDEGYFGGGAAGGMWRSMLAERIGEEIARSGGLGIADLLEDRKAAVAPGEAKPPR